MRRIFTLLVTLLAYNFASAQVAEDKAVELTATVQVSPPQITLHWKRVTVDTSSYQVFRKAKSAPVFPASPLATLTPTDSFYTDASVVADSAYEYQVFAFGSVWGSSGYIYAGIKNPAIHNRGALILMVDSTFSDSCAFRIKRLMDDLSGDGWQVIRHDFLRARPDTFIKSVIKNDYVTHANVNALLILGHIAVPYSSDFDAVINPPPDGHIPQHQGAWPADVYYSCITGTWTDITANDVLGSFSANWNVPGDGKWDQVGLPSAALLQVGRVDVSNMPAFASTEVQMMNRYLDKDHTYKMDSLNVIHRGLVDDHFGYFADEAFAANGWRNFSPLVGRDSVQALPLISTLATSSYQWAYGTGPGSFTSAGGVGVTADFAANPNNSIFSMLFGSYFGDWNVQDNLLRAPLCANPPSLTDCWAGRPNWFFHHMALGENIGYSARLSQNNTNVYLPQNYGAGFVHVALMGDPSLRTDYIKPPAALTITAPFHSGAVLNWTASPDAGVIGYYVYRTDSQYGYYQRLNATMITGTTYHDYSATLGLKYYMVRPVKLQSTPSGSYYNLGVGITDTVTITFSVAQVANVAPSVSLSVFPNPAQNYMNVVINTDNPCIATMFVINEMGQTMTMATKQLNAGNNAYSLNVAGFVPGNYTLVVKTGSGQFIQKWTKL
jgi:hypothetical protein